MTPSNPLPQQHAPRLPVPEAFETPFVISPPDSEEAPIVFASPHSGSLYPQSMLDALRVPLMDLRRTEDAFVEELFSDVPYQGGLLMAARYGRSVADLNRDPRELDASMFSDGAPRTTGLPTARVEAGLGCLPRIGSAGEAIYARLLTRDEGEARLTGIHDAYHERLQLELVRLSDAFGTVVLIDCHSMPSVQPGRRNLADIVLGDRFGSSCDPRLTSRAERAFRSEGFAVTRNAPYAGGFTTRRYGRPRRHQHALQIEINRGLYMDEAKITKNSEFDALRATLSRVVADLVGLTRELADL